MKGLAAALTLLTLCFPKAASDAPEIPPHLSAWKFEKDANGHCRFDYYQVSLEHGTDHKEHLSNYLPLKSFPSSCYDGHSKMGLNLIENSKGNYVFAACFFFPDQNQRLICQHLHNDHGFVHFVDVQCNDEKLARSEGNRYFIMAAFLTEKEANYVEYCVQEHCCRVYQGTSVVLNDDKSYIARFDAVLGILGGFGFDTTQKLSDQFNGYRFYHFEDSGDVNEYNGPAFYFGKRFNYYHVAHEKIEVFDNYDVTFLGIKYNNKAGQCVLVLEKAGTKFNHEIDSPCLDHLIGEGYNVEWSMEEQTAYLRGCFVSIHQNKGPRLVCHLFRNGTLHKKGIVDYYFFGGCQKHLVESAPIHVIVGTGPEKFVAIETESKLCKVMLYEGKIVEKIENRTEYTYGYDTYIQEIIERGADGSIYGHPLDAPKTAGLHLIGNHLLVRVDDSKWLVVKDGKVETKDWKYAYVMEEAVAMTLNLL